tara:strand:+ start:3340 stop:4668 length:1329 start_codon:yes stop_codon:yes gene_type:complete
MDHKLIKKFIVLFSMALILYVASNAANALLVNLLGHELYGDYSISISLVFALSPILALGSLNAVTKYVPLYLHNQQKGEVHSFLRWNLSLFQRLSILLIFILILFISFRFIVPFFSGWVLISHRYDHLFFDIMFVLPLALLTSWLNRLLNATGSFYVSQIFGSGSIVYFSAFLVFILMLSVRTVDHSHLLLVVFFGFFMLSIIQGVIIKYVIIGKKIHPQEVAKAKRSKQKEDGFLKDGISMMINTLAFTAIGLLCQLMLEWMHPDETSLGHYVIVLKIGALSGLVSSAMSFLFSPAFSGLKYKNRRLKFQKLLSFNAGISFIWLIMSVFLFLIFKDFIFKYYQVNFDHASEVILSLLFLNYISGSIGRFITICNYNDLSKYLFYIRMMQFFVAAILCFLLIPSMSYVGAIIGLFSANIFGAVCAAFLLRKEGIHVKVFGFV